MLTVLIATHNGADTLPVVLEAYTKLKAPDGDWKLVIVDNGSTDSTNETIRAFTRRLPLTYVFEPRRGKNRALNTGLASGSEISSSSPTTTLSRSLTGSGFRSAAGARRNFTFLVVRSSLAGRVRQSNGC